MKKLSTLTLIASLTLILGSGPLIAQAAPGAENEAANPAEDLLTGLIPEEDTVPAIPEVPETSLPSPSTLPPSPAGDVPAAPPTANTLREGGAVNVPEVPAPNIRAKFDLSAGPASRHTLIVTGSTAAGPLNGTVRVNYQFTYWGDLTDTALSTTAVFENGTTVLQLNEETSGIGFLYLAFGAVDSADTAQFWSGQTLALANLSSLAELAPDAAIPLSLRDAALRAGAEQLITIPAELHTEDISVVLSSANSQRQIALLPASERADIDSHTVTIPADARPGPHHLELRFADLVFYFDFTVLAPATPVIDSTPVTTATPPAVIPENTQAPGAKVDTVAASTPHSTKKLADSGAESVLGVVALAAVLLLAGIGMLRRRVRITG
ncbi:hypothetical protein [Mycetocola spongiae]|uniref:hypothetical protein n=1 Tax=Mycetocola spongiae TaxID=2859226 RepID=UPI001CF3AA00|nr:hypothetical protein [Mycetocola spongiae]UCR89912.1 hypothetical protein KXZ72_04380 [Mycetocola spongiae]